MPAPPPAPLILIFVPHTLLPGSRSGVQRVVISLGRELAAIAETELVTWDDVDGQMRFCDDRDMRTIFHGNRPKALRVNPTAQAYGRRFQDQVPAGRDVWMLFPEIFYHLPNGAAVAARVVTQCLEAGWRTAALLYDLIPILNDEYSVVREQHQTYLAQLLRCDLILPISHHVEAVFRAFAEQQLSVSEADLAAAGTRIAAVPLADFEPMPLPPKKGPDRDRILLLGTIEPRKRQTAVIRAYKELRAAGEMPLKLQVIGSLHPDSATEFTAMLQGEPSILYQGYLPEADLENAFARTKFTVFASSDEGFGLPIAESLSRGIPCLTANFGAMAEVAAGGGCVIVDVMDPAEIRRAMRDLAGDDTIIDGLRAELAQRTPRGWAEYAHDIAALLTPRDPALPDQIARALAAAEGVPETGFAPGSPEIIFGAAAANAANLFPPLRIATTPAEAEPPPDILLLPDTESLERVIAEAERRPELGTLPGWIDSSGNPATQARLLQAAIQARTQQALIALRERNFSKALAQMDVPFPRCMLSIVISTYNRALFVAANVAWIAKELATLGPAVELVVVDNCSTDDSETYLAPYRGQPGIRIVTNPTNVGMLGNLKVCASLMLANHVWLIGDDDFIVPGALHDIVRIISVRPGLPMVLLNFAVYHRAAMTPGDSPEMFLAEQMALAPDAVPTGPIRVIEGGSQHDNMFTAIYPIVFRADLAAGVFNHFFRGAPFRSLTESVPTSQFILGCYALTNAYWIKDVCIVGNAHNSWQRHRVAWHAVLMPLVFRLGRRAGMDPQLMRRWADLHTTFFEDACRLFPNEGLAAELDEDSLAASHQTLRRRLLQSAPKLDAT